MKALKFTLVMLLVAILLPFAQAQNTTTQDRNVGSFDGISVGGGIDVHITQGGSQSVKVEAASDKIDKVITEIKGNTLVIRYENGNKNWKNWNHKTGNTIVHVKTKDLKKISASGGSDVVSNGKLKLNELYLNASGGSDVKLDLETKNLVCQVSGGSDTDLTGNAQNLEIQASGGSDFNGGDFEATNCTVQASGGSDTHVHVTSSLVVNASGASDVYYSGNPSKTKLNSSGSSDIHSRSRSN